MATETITIPKKEFHRLKRLEKVDQHLLQDIAKGIKDIAKGKLKEI